MGRGGGGGGQEGNSDLFLSHQVIYCYNKMFNIWEILVSFSIYLTQQYRSSLSVIVMGVIEYIWVYTT